MSKIMPAPFLRLPPYIAETDTEQWGFDSLLNLNKWVELKALDVQEVTVYSTCRMAVEEWKQNDK
jgi:hypothetical protein